MKLSKQFEAENNREDKLQLMDFVDEVRTFLLRNYSMMQKCPQVTPSSSSSSYPLVSKP